MEKSKFLYGALGLLALGFTACSSDEPLGFQDEKVEKTETRYLSVAIGNPTNYMSRADDFEDGTESESAVNSLIFVFYDGAGNPTATMKTFKGTNASQGWQNATTDPSVTKFWSSVIPVEMSQGQNKPVYVVCYVNPIDQTNLSTATLTEIDAMTREAVVSGTTDKYFAMSNSVYYGPNPITGQSNVRMMATPITNQLYSTEDEAKANPALDIYVERYAAKIGLTMASTAIEEYPVKVAAADGTLTESSIIYTPTAWRPNAIDEKTYITKAFATGTRDLNPSIAPSYADLNKAFEGTGLYNTTNQLLNWNNPDNYRSYWACSPSYYANAYPKCSDDITDGNDYDLSYFTYNQMVADGVEYNGGFAATPDGNGYFYSRETTASIENIKGVKADGITVKSDYNNKAVVASAVIVGNYKLEGAEDTEDFWLFGKSEGTDILYTSLPDITNALINNQNVIFTDNQGTTPVGTDKAALFEVSHPSKDVRDQTTTVVPGRLVTIQLKEVPSPAVYVNLGAGFVAVDENNLVEANYLLWKSASTAQYFNKGLAFFSIPIRHLGWGVNTNGVPLLKDDEEGNPTANGRPSSILWENLRRGDLGVVRNHVYNITVSKVTGLGVGLASPEQPIVPPMDPDNYYMAAKINILSWRVVPTQTVTL